MTATLSTLVCWGEMCVCVWVLFIEQLQSVSRWTTLRGNVGIKGTCVGSEETCPFPHASVRGCIRIGRDLYVLREREKEMRKT